MIFSKNIIFNSSLNIKKHFPTNNKELNTKFLASSIPKLTDSLQLPASLNMSKTFYAVGIAGLIASIVGYFLYSDQFLHSYLTRFTFYSSIALACLIFVMIHHITKSS